MEFSSQNEKFQLPFEKNLVLGFRIVGPGQFLFPSLRRNFISKQSTNKMIKFKIKHSTLLMKNYIES